MLSNNIIGFYLYIKTNFFILLFIFLCFCINSCFSYISGIKHYTSTKLENGNIFLITNKGILIYDETLINLLCKNDLQINNNNMNNYNVHYYSSIKQFSEEDGGYILLNTYTNFYIISLDGNNILNKIDNFNNIGNPFQSIIPYDYSNNSYYFYYIYNNKQYIYFEQYTYNSHSNEITSSNITNEYFSELCSNHNNFVSCQKIKYKNEKSIICFISSHYNSNIFMKIYDSKTFSEKGSSTLWFIGSENIIYSAKGIIKEKEMILMITRELKWAGYHILENSYKSYQGNITLINGCNLASYIKISYINETEEFILYFAGSCNIEGYQNNFIFIYTFDENFNCSFFGTVRPFNLWDSDYCCNPFNSYNNTNWLSSYYIFFSSFIQRYVIIGSTEYTNDTLTFILNKDIKIINYQEKIFKLHSPPEFVCEDYKNINKNCTPNLSLNESLIKNFSFIEKCSFENKIIESSCPTNMSFNYIEFNITYSQRECDLMSHIEGKCKIKEEETKSSEETYQNLVNLIGDSSMDSKLDNLLYGDKEDIKINDEEGNEYLITSTDNLKDNTKHTNTIDFGECEEILKSNYSINANESLIILKIDKNNENKDSIRQVEYEVFHPYTKTLLNLSFCKDTKIDIFYQLSSDKFKNTDQLNQSSDFYNDLCYTNNANDNGIDMTVNERRKNYIPSCEKNCELIDFDIVNNKTQCSCDVKSEVTIFNIKIDTNELYKEFTNISFSNIHIIKCYYLLFKKENILFNIGNYIILGIILIYIICFFIFIFKGYNSLKNNINIFVNFIPSKNKRYSKNIVITTDKEPKGIKKSQTIKKKRKSKNIDIKSNPSKKGKRKRNKSITININNFSSQNRIIKDLSSSRRNIGLNQSNTNNFQVNSFNDQNNTNKQKQAKRSSAFQKARSLTNRIIKRNSQDNKIFKRSSLNNKILKRKSFKSKSFKRKSLNNNTFQRKSLKSNTFKRNSLKTLSLRNSKIMLLNDYEINKLDYSEALKYDKRVFFQYYWSLLKAGHIGIFAFVPNNDYNSRVIKVCLFFFSFALLYTVNSLFFTDSSMNNILVNNGKFDFIFQIVQIIYSTLISLVVNLIMKVLALTQQDVLVLKVIKKGETLGKKLNLLNKKLIIKFTLFFIISFSLLILFWFFVSCFCAVYRNTQIFLISDTLISFGLSLIYPFGIYLIPGIFRITALRNKNCEFIYKLSLFAQLF